MTDKKPGEQAGKALMGCLIFILFTLAIIGLAVSLVYRLTHW